MTALSDAERAVAEARDALIRRLRPWSSDPAEADATTDALIAAVRAHDAEIACEFAEQEDGHLHNTAATAYVQGIRDTANRIAPKEAR